MPGAKLQVLPEAVSTDRLSEFTASGSPFHAATVWMKIEEWSLVDIQSIGGRTGGGGDMSPLEYLVGDIPKKFQGGRKIGEKNKEKEKK